MPYGPATPEQLEAAKKRRLERKRVSARNATQISAQKRHAEKVQRDKAEAEAKKQAKKEARLREQEARKAAARFLVMPFGLRTSPTAPGRLRLAASELAALRMSAGSMGCWHFGQFMATPTFRAPLFFSPFQLLVSGCDIALNLIAVKAVLFEPSVVFICALGQMLRLLGLQSQGRARYS